MYHDLRDLADLLSDPDLSNDDYCALRDLAAQYDYMQTPEIHAGPVTEYERERVAAILNDAADDDPTLIPTDEFTDYARELAEECGATAADDPRTGQPPWPLYCIDWDRAAYELSHDYSVFTYQGQEYYNRA